LAGMGVMVGEVTPTGALVQVRLTTADRLVNGDVPGAPGVVEFRVSADGDGAQTVGKPQLLEAAAERDFIARAAFTGLKPGTRYLCRTRIGKDRDSLRQGPEARFTTLYGADQSAATSFVVVTGMNYAKFHGDNRIDRAIHRANNNRD